MPLDLDWQQGGKVNHKHSSARPTFTFYRCPHGAVFCLSLPWWFSWNTPAPRWPPLHSGHQCRAGHLVVILSNSSAVDKALRESLFQGKELPSESCSTNEKEKICLVLKLQGTPRSFSLNLWGSGVVKLPPLDLWPCEAQLHGDPLLWCLWKFPFERCHMSSFQAGS